MKKNLLCLLCIFINLLIGNIGLIIFDLPVIYHVLISFGIMMIYGFSFYKLGNQVKDYTKLQLIGIAVLLSLSGMLVACIFTAVGNRLPMDNMITAAMKGIVPTFVFAIPVASPFWIPVAVLNFVCLNSMKNIER